MILGFTSRPNKKRAGNTARLLLLGLTFFLGLKYPDRFFDWRKFPL